MAGQKHEMDKGWAWVVLACSWMSLFLVCFLSATAGILQVEIIEDLGVGSGPVSIMTSLALGLASLLGPLSGIMASLLSARVTVFLGTILMTLGMLATSFSYTIPAMMIFYGIITGLGCGIAYSPIVVIISFYFEKQRMLANGIILCASGVGMLSLPFFERYIIDSYGWRFAFAVNAAFMLHILVFAAAFFPTEMETVNMIDFSSFFCGNMNQNMENENNVNNKVFDEENETGQISENGELKHIGIRSRKYDMILKSGLMVDSSSLKSKSQSMSLNGSILNEINSPQIPVYITEPDDVKRLFPSLVDGVDVSLTCETPLKTRTFLEEKENGVSDASPFRQRTFSELSSQSIVSTDTHASAYVLPRSHEKFKFGQLRKANGQGRSYLGSSLGWASADLRSSLMFPVKIEEMANAEREEKSSLTEQIIRICKNKAVWILSTNSLFFISAYAIHGVHFPSYAESKGMSRKQVAQFYIAFGLVLMVGRLVGGLVYNKLKPPLCILMFILQSLNGIFMGLAPFYATTAVGIYIMQASFGLFYGQSYMVLPAVIAQLLGVQDLAIAFGIIHLFMGLGYILAPIIAGFIYDVTETYDIPYYMGGALFLLGALSLILMIFIKREADAGEVNRDKEDKKDKMEDKEAAITKTTPLMDKEKI